MKIFGKLLVEVVACIAAAWLYAVDLTHIDVNVGEDGSVVTMEMDDVVKFPDYGKVLIGGSVGKLRAGTYVILKAPSMTGTVAGWVVESPAKSDRYELSIVGKEVRLTVKKRGFLAFMD